MLVFVCFVSVLCLWESVYASLWMYNYMYRVYVCVYAYV